MRNLDDLDRSKLHQIVESIRNYLFLDLDDEGQQFWNPEKDTSGADFVEHVTWILSEQDLVPEDPVPIQPG